ncbi:MAG TPA: cation:proton antiporter [Pilimelia sp.]|nr:cation:proton antiporter [Pilimelia sp.]
MFLLALHTLAVLAAVLGLAAAARRAAAALRQPGVLGEMAAGLLAGPLLLALLGPAATAAVLPPGVLTVLRLVAKAALVLYVVGLAYGLRRDRSGTGPRALGWVAAGGLVPGMCAGAALALWIIVDGDPALRGTAPTAAFVLYVGVALAITSVPVLARILADRGLAQARVGRLSLSSAILIDAVGWLVLALAVGLLAGDSGRFVQALALLGGGGLAALGLRRALGAAPARRFAAGRPLAAAVALAAAGFAAGLAMEWGGQSAILGAAVVGLALPADCPAWSAAVARVGAPGRALVPAFFVVTGLALLDGAHGAPSWALLSGTLLLAMGAKVGGGYLGARRAGEERADALRVGVLMNSRGLTELIVLQVGYEAGLMSGRLYLVLVVMALLTTAVTGPLLSAVTAVQRRRPAWFGALAGATP